MLCRDGGQAVVLVLLTVVALIGFAALVVNVGHLVIAKVRLQNAADLTAFSAAAFQAEAMNKIARLNLKAHDKVQDWRNGHPTFHSKTDGKNSIEASIAKQLDAVEKINYKAAVKALEVAAEVGRANYPGAAVSQVGFQRVKGSSGSWQPNDNVLWLKPDPERISLQYYYYDSRGHKTKVTKRFDNPYPAWKSTAMFWARLQAPLPPMPWLAEGFKEPLPVLTAESMAQPYNGHLGRVSGMGDLAYASDSYEVKFAPIGHLRLKSSSPYGYFVYAAAPSRGLTGEIVSESMRRTYAH